MPRDWTDWAPIGAQACPGEPLVIDVFGLLALAELLPSLTSKTSKRGLDR
jgi:hypothetical protein